jgi:hypothetical protein
VDKIRFLPKSYKKSILSNLPKKNQEEKEKNYKPIAASSNGCQIGFRILSHKHGYDFSKMKLILGIIIDHPTNTKLIG